MILLFFHDQDAEPAALEGMDLTLDTRTKDLTLDTRTKEITLEDRE